ncbi:hypothetical protein ABB37_02221 [Leptomonas pyrrhocoris]|uniref:Cyclic nucleotide-binding domain-containing protein n=1 Tax=Leptomonas pyrrhocoris TaxID=157538 RepID=A0A0N0DYL4_LEPPY|nr:hypothetical protein ABB37_02221 [Leptomonas pyrrhocoris]XP_015662582.1 hypothetical protein ABB37_02221 [Leptomonas pyrrhocoris]KPA84142.1 hypothetical protein ABB37_02221 [Leptomonas pyrrhocoris]KPA84143.1 hypothetical protein ABB37_02221 [Leptomonas pyrrhocoris]|eukprot:XP_015662581.1 hypothetical protein ABB37_02221 [Leptomonas pyrrhocoris]
MSYRPACSSSGNHESEGEYYWEVKKPPPPVTTLPNQNQLYAFYLTRCGHHGVRKPHRAVLALLAEDTPSHTLRLTAEAAERGVAAADLAHTEDSNADAACVAARASVAALAQQRTFCLAHDSGAGVPIYVGARGMLPLLDLVAELPLLEELDFSTVSSWYDNDTVASCSVAGNDVVLRLCEILPRLCALRVLNLSGHPIGCAAGERLLAAVRAAPTVVEVHLDGGGLSTHLINALQQTLRDHREAEAQNGQRRLIAADCAVPPYISALPLLDRKTLREQQVLRAMLEEDVNFASVVSKDDLAAMVLTARVMSTTEAIFRCGKAGILGDGAHLFIVKSGSLRVYVDLVGVTLGKGDYFGDNYDATLIPCSHLVEEQRGLVYAVPLTSCAQLVDRWALRVGEAWPWLQRTPLLQAVGAWAQLRVGTCCVWTCPEPAETIVEVGSGEGDLFIVCDGAYAALDVRDGDTAQFSERNVRCVFTRYDVFGVEASVARRHTSSVRIKAGKEKDTAYRLLQMRGCGVRLLQQQLRPVFASLARSYSLHADLCAGEAPSLDA